MNSPASSPFFHTRADRLQLARKRYFEEGITPVGVIHEAIFHSWARCQRLHSRTSKEVTFQPVTTSRTQLALQKSHDLLQAWRDELPQLESVLGTTSCAAMLTDASGVLIGSSCAGRSHEQLMPVATRLGVDLSEEAVGTNAPGIVARTGQAHSVLGGEHFFEGVKAMSCAAAPIRGADGQVAGVIDISSEAFPFGFDASSVVGLFAGALENRLLVSQSTNHLVLRLQVAPVLLDSPMVGLIGISSNGALAWSNGVAAKLLGMPSSGCGPEPMSAEDALGMQLHTLAAMPRSGAATIHLRSGLQVWVRAEMRTQHGREHIHAVSPGARAEQPGSHTMSGAREERRPVDAEARTELSRLDLQPQQATTTAATSAEALPTIGAATLRDSDRNIIQRTVDECGGNIAKAAKLLQVSRGLIYRRLKACNSTKEH